jgi:protein gp37
MTDLGHETVQPAWRQAIYATIERCPQHTFILLTKRPGPWLLEVPPQVWVGVSIESADFLHRWNVIAQLARPAVRLVSVEPMLGPVSFAGCDRQPDWVIAGPETGPQARPCDAAWLEALAAESPVFFDKRKGDRRREFPQPTQG